MAAVWDFLRRRRAAAPLGYPWGFVMFAYLTMMLIVLEAVAQRGFALHWHQWLALPLASVCGIWFVATGKSPHAYLMIAATVAATALLVSEQQFRFDFAPLLLVFAVGDVASYAPVRQSVVATAATVAFLLFAASRGWVDGLALHLCFLWGGFMMGYLASTQQRLLLAERELRAHLVTQGAADERRRIAREIHDVIAHSLSITMLHVTGARRALEQDRDVEDAVGGLVEAERLGRQAMTDIRRTVGLLGDGQATLAPEPGVGDIAALVRDFTAAGLRIDFRREGDLDDVSAATALGLYRIVQESLANVAKHAPEGETSVLLHASTTKVVLSIVNDLPHREAQSPDGLSGSGLSGMRQRAEQLGGRLHVDRGATRWAVRVEIPLMAHATRRRGPRAFAEQA